jgi:hypothetical protein
MAWQFCTKEFYQTSFSRISFKNTFDESDALDSTAGLYLLELFIDITILRVEI